MGFGSRLKEVRLLRGLTQEALGELVGTTKGAIANYESDTSSPREDILIRLFNALNVEPNYLYQDYISENASVPTIKIELKAEEYDIVIAYRKAHNQIKQGIRNLLGMKESNREPYPADAQTGNGKNFVESVSNAYSQKASKDGHPE